MLFAFSGDLETAPVDYKELEGLVLVSSCQEKGWERI